MLARFILEQRKKRNLTQEDIASELRISRPTYLQIERGERDLTLPEAERLSKKFGIPFHEFIRGVEVSASFEIGKAKHSRPLKEELRISVPQEKAEKFRQVLRYILKKVGGKPNVGMTVIYKLLYFMDFDYYEKHEEQLMGLVYIRNNYGPTPVMFKKFIDEMVEKGEVEEVKSKFYKYPQTKYLINPAVEPDLSVLDGEEKEHIDWELTRLSDMTATQLSDLSHKDVPWISAEDGKQMDYEAVFYRTAETSVRDYGGASED